MQWLHHDAMWRGKVDIVEGREAIRCESDMGAVTTGRQRVFSRYYVRVTLPDGSMHIGEHSDSFRDALRVLDRVLRTQSITLIAAGLCDDFEESGLSWNTGYGWLSDCDHAVHMMDSPPPRWRDHGNDEFAESLVREAVDGMAFGRGTAR